MRLTREQQREYLKEVRNDFPNLMRRIAVLDAMRFVNRLKEREKRAARNADSAKEKK